jgi:hypothetical protein
LTHGFFTHHARCSSFTGVEQRLRNRYGWQNRPESVWLKTKKNSQNQSKIKFSNLFELRLISTNKSASFAD